ncbi:MAG: 23S rRNA (uracil(1939)-C(5))-methyltransferase RlmD [Bacillota bacterium]
MIKKGDIIEIELVDMANGGDCVGRYDGMAVFIPAGVPGEKVKAKIIEKKKNYARGELLEIMEEEDNRISPQCCVFGACGGCQLQHMDYQSQLKYKRKMVVDLLERIGKIDYADVNDVIGADYPFGYRNKAQFPLTEDEEGNIVTGFYRKGTHQVVVHNNCHIQHPLINRIIEKTLKVLNQYKLSVYNELVHKGLLRHLVVRVGVCTNQALLIIVIKERHFQLAEEISDKIFNEVPELVGVLYNINPDRTNVIMGKETRLVKGNDRYIDYIGPVKYAISPHSFFQVNSLQTKKLYDVILDFASFTEDDLVFDAYCGIGSISLYIANRVMKVVGVEIVKEAVRDAEKNAELNHISNSQFIVGSVEQELPGLLKSGDKPDIIIFDPPRKGIDEKAIDAVLTTGIEKIIYVSCNPATLARDLEKFDKCYRVEKVQPVDMFPNTTHVETVVLLKKGRLKR